MRKCYQSDNLSERIYGEAFTGRVYTHHQKNFFQIIPLFQGESRVDVNAAAFLTKVIF